MSIQSMLLTIFLPYTGMSFLFLMFGLLSKRFPSKYGSNTGYNTPTSRKCEEVWNYAQQIFPGYALQTSLVLFSIGIFICIFIFTVGVYIFHSYGFLNEQISVKWSLVISQGSLFIAIIISVLLLFLRVELKLRTMLKGMQNKELEQRQ